MAGSTQELEGELTRVEDKYWAVSIADPQARNSWLALKVFEMKSLEAQVARLTGQRATISKNEAAGMVFIEGPRDFDKLMHFLETNYLSYRGRSITWRRGAPPEPTICPE
jgi:hypothetical protein